MEKIIFTPNKKKHILTLFPVEAITLYPSDNNFTIFGHFVIPDGYCGFFSLGIGSHCYFADPRIDAGEYEDLEMIVYNYSNEPFTYEEKFEIFINLYPA